MQQNEQIRFLFTRALAVARRGRKLGRRAAGLMVDSSGKLTTAGEALAAEVA